VDLVVDVVVGICIFSYYDCLLVVGMVVVGRQAVLLFVSTDVN
jgi:hypothetical protein